MRTHPTRRAAVTALVRARMTHSHEVLSDGDRFVIRRKRTGFEK